MNLIPFRLSPHLAHYFFKEFEGNKRIYAGRVVKSIPIDESSFLGKFIISYLKKIDYPVKNIDSFNVFIEMINIKRKVFCKKNNIFKKENLHNSFVELPEEHIKEIEEMLEDLMRQNFFYFVDGYCKGDGEKVQKGIRQFIDDYSLWETKINVGQLHRLYYRMKNDGPATRIQNKGKYHVKFLEE